MDHDVIILGGGVAGLTLGAALAPHADVLLLEGEDALGHHASGRSAALFEVNYGTPAVRALTRASAPFYETGGYLSPRGVMLLAHAGEEEAFAPEVADMGLSRLTDAEADALLPIRAAPLAAANPDTPGIDTDRLLQDGAKAIRAAGGTIRTRARAAAIRPGWTVEAGGGTHRAPVLVNAAGAWADAVAALAGVRPCGIVPHRRSIAVADGPDGADMARWPMIFGLREAWYAKPEAGRLLISPADETPVEPHDAWADDMDLAEGIAAYEAHVTHRVTRVRSSWAGLRSFAPDRVLVLGPDPDAPGFFWLAGQGGQGFQTAPAAAALLTDMILGRPLEAGLAAALSPARFR